MKYKIFFIFTLFFLFNFFSYSYAQTPTKKPATTTQSPSPTEESNFDNLSTQINDLKERIASRVAQLRLVEKRGIIGTVTEASNTQITLTDIQGNTRFVDVDAITKFSSVSSKGSFGISDVSKGMKISVIGLYNKQSRRILGRFVNVYIVPTIINGTVLSRNADDFSMEVATEDGKKRTVDVENVTKTNSYSKEDGISRAGFSKIEVDKRVVVVGYPDKKDPDRIVASRVLLLPELPKNPRISPPAVIPEEPEPTAVETITPTPSPTKGKKLTPTR